MSTLSRRGPNANAPAKLPGIQTSRIDDPATRQALEALREWVEVRLGSRGDKYERVVTLRDLEKLGLVSSTGTASSTSASSTSDLADRLTAVEKAVSNIDTGAVTSLKSTVANLQAAVQALTALVYAPRVIKSAAGSSDGSSDGTFYSPVVTITEAGVSAMTGYSSAVVAASAGASSMQGIAG